MMPEKTTADKCEVCVEIIKLLETLGMVDRLNVVKALAALYGFTIED